MIISFGHFERHRMTPAEYTRMIRAEQRANESTEQREARLAYQREYARKRRAAMNDDERYDYLANQRAANRKHRAKGKEND